MTIFINNLLIMKQKHTFEVPKKQKMLFIRKKRTFRFINDFENDYYYIKTRNLYLEKFFEKSKETDEIIDEFVKILFKSKFEYKLQPRNRRLQFMFLNDLHFIDYDLFGYFHIKSHYQSDEFKLPVKITAKNATDLINKMIRFNVVHKVIAKKLLERP